MRHGLLAPLIPFLWTSAAGAPVESRCLSCHPEQVKSWEKTAMAHSLARSAAFRPGAFVHAPSGTTFSFKPAGNTLQITMSRAGLNAIYSPDYVIGSGQHAYGFLIRIGNYLFQAPVSFYSQRGIWDVAPGFESWPAPDFGRPISPECLECHAGHPRPIAGALNRYADPPFSDEAISCDRCHGDASEHLRSPGRKNIVNPLRLSTRARDSICEQCHLSGEARILNPGRQWGDFKPGQELEEVFSIYVRNTGDAAPGASIKVISHAEQLALSACARNSGGKLWCGTCHDPHSQPEPAAKHYRERCLSCHGEGILQTHIKPVEDCAGCHMPKRKAWDGAHSVFTDHRIARAPLSGSQESAPPMKLRAWHEPRGALALRNLGLANIEVGERERSAALMGEGAGQVVEAMKSFPPDPVMLTTMGLILLRGGEASDAIEVLQHALQIAPERAGSHVNLGNAYKEAGLTSKAITEFERAIELDPSLEDAYRFLEEVWLSANNPEAARKTLEQYLKFMPQNIEARKVLRESHNR